MELTVAICTHNPRTDFLLRTIESMRRQDLPYDRWEFMVIDNASERPLADRLDLSWHPNAQVRLEPELGLVNGRLHTIRNASAPIIVFADDDNVLSPDYLSNTLKIAAKYPFLGAWGGSQNGEFERRVQPKHLPYVDMLALRKVTRAVWSNRYDWRTSPAGAGMVIRKDVGEEFARQSLGEGLKLTLGRKGASLASGEDVDLAWTALSMGYGCGLFPELSLKHLIAEGRLEEEYLIRLKEGISYSSVMVRYIHGVDEEGEKVERASILDDSRSVRAKSPLKWQMYRLYRRLFTSGFDYKMWEAELRGKSRAVADLKSML